MPDTTQYQQDLVDATKLIFSGQSGAGADLLDIAKTEILASILAQLERIGDTLDRWSVIKEERLRLDKRNASRAPLPVARAPRPPSSGAPASPAPTRQTTKP
jgi:hypothetical protein